MLRRMAHDMCKAQEQLTPDARRQMLRAFGDRMLLKLTAMDDPEDLPGVERAVRTAAAIERIYSRCDRAEKHAPDPRKLEAERANNAQEAIKARVNLADMLEWGEKRRQKQGQWWDAADTSAPVQPCIQPKAKATEPASFAIAQDIAQAATPEAAPVSVPSPAQAAAMPYTASVSACPSDDFTATLTLPPVEYVDYTADIRAFCVKHGLPYDDEDYDELETGGCDPPSG